LTRFETGERVAKPTKFGELPAATAGVIIWLIVSFSEGPSVGLKYAWLLLLGAWTLSMRLRYQPERLRMTIGPWRRGVDLTTLESINLADDWRVAKPGDDLRT
jgi:hypothetical protein